MLASYSMIKPCRLMMERSKTPARGLAVSRRAPPPVATAKSGPTPSPSASPVMMAGRVSELPLWLMKLWLASALSPGHAERTGVSISGVAYTVNSQYTYDHLDLVLASLSI